jgi:hypothetical protein
VKDMKLARPAGLSPECSTETCPSAVESPWADHGRANLAANLRGLERVLFGGPRAEAATRTGFDDLLVGVSAADLAADLGARVEAAQAAVDGIPGELKAAVATDPAPVRAAHGAVKAITDLLKSRFVTVLALRAPDEGAADND